MKTIKLPHQVPYKAPANIDAQTPGNSNVTQTA